MTDKLVLDASAAIAAVTNREETSSDLLNTIDAATAIVVPEIFTAEVTNGMWKYIRAGIMSPDEAARSLRSALRFVSKYVRAVDMAEEVLRECAERRHPAYDLYYAVLARREGAAVLSLDRRLKQLCRDMNISLAAE